MTDAQIKLWQRTAYLGFFAAAWVVIAFIGRLYLGIIDPYEIQDIMDNGQLPPPENLFPGESVLKILIIMVVYCWPWLFNIVWQYHIRAICVKPERRAYVIILDYLFHGMFFIGLLLGGLTIHIELFATDIAELQLSIRLLEIFSHFFTIMAKIAVFIALIPAYLDRRIHRWFALMTMIYCIASIGIELWLTNPDMPIIRYVYGIFEGHIAIVIMSVYFYLIASAAAKPQPPDLDSAKTITAGG